MHGNSLIADSLSSWLRRQLCCLKTILTARKRTRQYFFSLDGTEYEIDLNDGHANELREALERFTDAGRKVTGGRGSKQTTSARKTGQSGIDAKAVRQWATENGIQVNARGRIQAELVERYLAGH